MAITAELAILGGAPAVEARAHNRWPDVRQEDREAVLGVLDRGVLSAGSALDTGLAAPEITALEQGFAQFLGVKHCLSLNSGTAALHCCAAAIGLEPGDEVIVPAFTFIATPVAMAHHGLVPVFCDIDSRTFNMDPADLERRVTPRTRAVMPVHIHGLPADMDEIFLFARKHALRVIEDAAQAHGARYRGRLVGTLGDCAAFSLNVTKNLSGGEGGLFVSNDDQHDVVARRLANFGEDMPPPSYFGRYYWSHGLGWNYRNQELSAAFARSQLARLEDYNAVGARNAAILTDGLADVPGIRPPYVPEDRSSVFHVYRVRLVPEELGWDGAADDLRDRVVNALRAEGAQAGTWQHHPLPAHPVFRRSRIRPWHPSAEGEPLRSWDAADYPVATAVLKSSLVLGSGSMPLQVQDSAVMEQYVAAVAKVLHRISELPPVKRADVPAP
jgi:dTDP-4-amino-4,6-dideoxygalactose transaminase